MSLFFSYFELFGSHKFYISFACKCELKKWNSQHVYVLMVIIFVFQNQTQVATSLQVFHNLGSLSETVHKVLSDCEGNIRMNIRTALSVQLLSSVSANQTRGIVSVLEIN